MNIFYTSPDPVECAKALDDKRVNKMTIESAQMLSTCARRISSFHRDELYRETHPNHPCNVWIRSERDNFLWLVEHGLALADEFQHRFRHIHASGKIVTMAKMHLPYMEFTNEIASFNCSGYDTGDVHHDYRLCMVDKWLKDTLKPRWTNRGYPMWQEIIDAEG